MNCDELRAYLVGGEGGRETEVEQHIAACPACREMLSSLGPVDAAPSAECISSIAARIGSSLTPVRPLPSDSWLIAGGFVFFVLFSLFAALLLGFSGFARLSAGTRLVYFVMLGLLSTLLSITVAHAMVPGSPRRLRPSLVLALSLIVPLTLAAVLFPKLPLEQFAARGMPCFAVGLACALLAGILAYVFVRHGYFVAPALGGAAVGCFCGLAGFTVLALHCPLQDALHVAIWHGGALLVSSLAGAAVGLWRARKHDLTS